MAGRTVGKWIRVYINGYRMSGYTSKIGPLNCEFTEQESVVLNDVVGGALIGQANISPGTLNGIFDNDAAGLFANDRASDVIRQMMVAIGDRAEPAAGVPVFAGAFRQNKYQAVGEGAVAATVEYAGWDVNASSLLYSNPWGYLLHADAAETAVNTAIGIDDYGAATSFGGVMAYQSFAGNGTATLKVQDAATNTNPSFADLSGATTGSLDFSNPAAGIVAIGTTATVRRYLRWQIVFGTATTVTFALAFLRNFHN